MNISLHIEATSPSELQEAITGLAGITGGVAAPQPKRTSRSNEKPVNKSDTESKSEQADKTEQDGKGSEDENIPTVVELRAKAQEKGTTPEGKQAIKALLDSFESKSISDIPEEKRVAFLRKLEAL